MNSYWMVSILKNNSLKDFTKIVIETDEKNPKIIAVITANNYELSDGFRVRMTPVYKD